MTRLVRAGSCAHEERETVGTMWSEPFSAVNVLTPQSPGLESHSSAGSLEWLAGAGVGNVPSGAHPGMHDPSDPNTDVQGLVKQVASFQLPARLAMQASGDELGPLSGCISSHLP